MDPESSRFRVLSHLGTIVYRGCTFNGHESHTQPGISSAISSTRSNVTRYLHDFIADGLVQVHSLHVPGRKRRVNVYYLTPRGISFLRDHA